MAAWTRVVCCVGGKCRNVRLHGYNEQSGYTHAMLEMSVEDWHRNARINVGLVSVWQGMNTECVLVE